MSVNKIIYGNTTLIDLTGDTVTASDVASGKTFHGKDGTQTTGTFTPTSITPSFSAPAMRIGNTYAPTANGYAIDTYYNATPSSTATELSSGNFYKMNSSGYLINTYNGVITPSADDSGTYFPSGFVKMSSSGYAYQNKPTSAVVKTGTFQGSTSATTKITLGFMPKFLYIGPEDPNETYKYQNMYDENFSTTQFLFSGGTSTAVETLGNTNNNRLATIDNDGFTFNKCGSGAANNTWRYTAIG